jgi:hypothetical protein
MVWLKGQGQVTVIGHLAEGLGGRGPGGGFTGNVFERGKGDGSPSREAKKAYGHQNVSNEKITFHAFLIKKILIFEKKTVGIFPSPQKG